MIEDKQKMADSIVGNDESWLTKLDNRAFNELIALNKNSVPSFPAAGLRMQSPPAGVACAM